MVDGDPFASRIGPAQRPVPWAPILGGAALLLLVLVVGFRDQLFGGDETPAADATSDGDKADKPDKPDKPDTAAGDAPDKAAKGEPAPATDAPPADAKTADAAPPAAADVAKAAPPPAPAPPPPAADDPAFAEKLAQARSAFERHKLKAADALLTELSQARPDHPEVLLLSAQVKLDKGDLAGSLASATRCVEVAASQAECWLTLGILQQTNKDDAAAIKAYETYLELAPTGRYARDATSQLARLKK